ncbi:MAG: hypothetical protein E6R07_14890 [Nevskiaceae bacterium]|nr:MAG: hypothetical protein E6R07_14890 [Nevskiaceae bacterium]
MNGRQWTEVDQTLSDSFPASDPPAWNGGRQKTQDVRKGSKPAQRQQRPDQKTEKPKRIRIGPSDVT